MDQGGALAEAMSEESSEASEGWQRKNEWEKGRTQSMAAGELQAVQRSRPEGVGVQRV